MTKKIAINGREFNGTEEDCEYLIGLLRNKEGVQIDYLEDWQTKTKICSKRFPNSRFQVTHEPYDFNSFIQQAKEYSDKNPPDVVQL